MILCQSKVRLNVDGIHTSREADVEGVGTVAASEEDKVFVGAGVTPG